VRLLNKKAVVVKPPRLLLTTTDWLVAIVYKSMLNHESVSNYTEFTSPGYSHEMMQSTKKKKKLNPKIRLFSFPYFMYLLSRAFAIKHTFSKKIIVSSTLLVFKQKMSTAAASDNKPAILKWASKDGEFRRQQSTFRDTIEDDANAKFAAEP
jgi:hypothetical protein